jgi:hypothetical protein
MNVVSLKSSKIEKQYANFYQKCGNYDLSVSEVMVVKKQVRDIHKEMVKGYIELLTTQIG